MYAKRVKLFLSNALTAFKNVPVLFKNVPVLTVFGYKMSYGRMIEVQARMLAAHVRGDIPEYTDFTVR